MKPAHRSRFIDALVGGSLFFGTVLWHHSAVRTDCFRLPSIAERQSLRDAPAPKEDFDEGPGEGSTGLLRQVQESGAPAVQVVPVEASGPNASEAPKDVRAGKIQEPTPASK